MYMRLDVPPLDDSETVRHKLLFACGTLYDFSASTFRRGERSDRICRHLPWRYAGPHWDPVLFSALSDLLLGLHVDKVPSIEVKNLPQEQYSLDFVVVVKKLSGLARE